MTETPAPAPTAPPPGQEYAHRAMRELHELMLGQLLDARTRADAAERELRQLRERLDVARSRRRRAESQLQALRSSSAWRVGSALTALPAGVRRRLRARRR